MNYDPIKLEIFKHLFAAIAEEMGTVLRRASYSPNIKERRDFSCAIFNSRGQMIAQAAHIPVHLGSMPLSVGAAIEQFKDDLLPGDMVILNDPYRGGTHLPDITMISPVFQTSHSDEGVTNDQPVGFVACRAHHADIGGMTPGSMPVAREIFQEGLIIPPIKVIKEGKIDDSIFRMILANVRTPWERQGDLLAQIASNQRGEKRMLEMIHRYGLEEIIAAEDQLLEYSERMTRSFLSTLSSGEYHFTDVLDDDGLGGTSIPITVKLTIQGDSALVDFSGSAPQQSGSVNAVLAITLSAVYYVFRCLLGLDIPNNAGCFIPIKVIAPPRSIVNAAAPAPVAGGNVETSQRIVDVLLGALSQACPDRIPAASQGTMNNITIGGRLSGSELSSGNDFTSFTYYETIGGGTGARPTDDGLPAIHSHMTNTLNTPIEALEYAYPLRLIRYQIREGSGGNGRFRGGDGIIREIQVLTDCQVTLLSERRCFPPYGLKGGQPGKTGQNLLIREGKETELPGKGTIDLYSGDILSIRTPGGGGYGKEQGNPTNDASE
jgi:N-methylhydantoinase B